MENNRLVSIMCENIRAIRKINRLSKKDMAEKLKIGIKSLTMLENGVIPVRLSADILFRIYHSFGVAPSDLFKPL